MKSRKYVCNENFEDKEIIIFEIVRSEFFVILLHRNGVKSNPNET